MRYVGTKRRAFLTKQMTSDACRAALASSVTSSASVVAEEFTEAMRHSEGKSGSPSDSPQFKGEDVYLISKRYKGRPRVVLQMQVEGPSRMVFAMEYGSSKITPSDATRGSLRALIRKPS